MVARRLVSAQVQEGMRQTRIPCLCRLVQGRLSIVARSLKSHRPLSLKNALAFACLRP